MKILVADDDAVLQNELADLLRETGEDSGCTDLD